MSSDQPRKRSRLETITNTEDNDDARMDSPLLLLISNLFNKPELSDVQFHVEYEGKSKTFHAHKLVLLLRPNNKFEFTSTENPEIVKINDINPQSFSAFLMFLYTDQYEPSPIGNEMEEIFGVLYAANKFNVRKLFRICRDLIEKSLPFHIHEIFAIQRKLKAICPELFRTCWDFIDEKAETIITGSAGGEFLHIENDEFCEFLKRDGLKASELDLFKGAFEWAVIHCDKAEKPVTPENLRAALGPALFLMRFPTMKNSDFAVHVLPKELLTTEEERNVLHYISLKAANNPSLEYPKTAFNSAKRTKQVVNGWRVCGGCSDADVEFYSCCHKCGKRCIPHNTIPLVLALPHP